MRLLFHPAVFRRMIFLMEFLLLSAVVVGQVELRVSTGYQQERLRWSIAGNSSGRNPNVYSELKWRGVGGVAAGGDLQWKVWRNWLLFAEGSRQFISGGRVSDVDYSSDNRTGPVYNGNFLGNKGYAYALGMGFGYRWEPWKAWVLKPVAGYGWSGQRLSISDEAGLLDSRYQTRWRGVFLRCAGEWAVSERWGLRFVAGYRQVDYRAEADWNLIHTFSHPVSFRHWADGYGIEGGMGLCYSLNKRMGVELSGNYFSYQTGKGVDELYPASGPASQTQLNEVVLAGFAIGAGFRIAW